MLCFYSITHTILDSCKSSQKKYIYIYHQTERANCGRPTAKPFKVRGTVSWDRISGGCGRQQNPSGKEKESWECWDFHTVSRLTRTCARWINETRFEPWELMASYRRWNYKAAWSIVLCNMCDRKTTMQSTDFLKWLFWMDSFFKLVKYETIRKKVYQQNRKSWSFKKKHCINPHYLQETYSMQSFGCTGQTKSQVHIHAYQCCHQFVVIIN